METFDNILRRQQCYNQGQNDRLTVEFRHCIWIPDVGGIAVKTFDKVVIQLVVSPRLRATYYAPWSVATSCNELLVDTVPPRLSLHQEIPTGKPPS